jgi:hypothetical protein
MELPESAYLYALAQVGVVFAGFTALFTMLRQTLGGEPSPMDLFFTRNLLILSFLVVFGAMLPSLLAAFSLQRDLVWRAASAIVAVPLLAFVVSLPWRRRRVLSGRTPGFIWLRESIHVAVVAILAVNIVGLPGGAAGARFELGISLVLLAQSFSFVLTMSQLLAVHRQAK